MKHLWAALLVACLTTSPCSAGIYDDILIAADKNDTVAVVNLLRRGMDTNTADPSGNTLLMLAARNGNQELVDFLVQNRANLQKRNRYGDTALMQATYKGHLAIVRRLLDMGAEINHPGWNALHYAAHAGHFEIARELVGRKPDLEARAPNGQTALMLAAGTGHLDVVRLLLAAGAKLDAEDYEGQTALQVAEKNNRVEMIVLLKGASAR